MLKLFLTLAMLFSLAVSAPEALAEPSAYPQEVAEQLARGTSLLRDGKLGEARACFQKAVELEPNCHEAWNNIGLTYYRQDNLEKAGEAYMNAIEIEPGFIPSITNLGAVRHQQRRLDKATGLYRLALDLSQGKDPEIQYNYANVLRDQKDYAKAKQHYLKSIELRPDFPAAHNGLGATYYCLKEYPEAEREIKTAIKLKPDYALAYYHLGLLESALEHYDAAIDAYEHSLKFEDRRDYADDTREKISKCREKLKMASVASLTPSGGMSQPPAKAIVPGSTNSASGIVEQKMDHSVRNLENLLKSGGSTDPVLWNNYGLSLLHAGQSKTGEAILAFNNALKHSPKGAPLYQAHYNLAQAFRANGDLASAEKHCLKAIDAARIQGKICPLAHNLRAILLKQRKQFAMAEQEYKLAIAQSMGKYPVFHYNRALLLESMNRPKEAKQEYRYYIDNAPTGVNYVNAKLRLGLLSI